MWFMLLGDTLIHYLVVWFVVVLGDLLFCIDYFDVLDIGYNSLCYSPFI